MENIIRILLVEDNPDDAELVKRELKKASISCEIRWADSKASFLKELEAYHPDVILCDYKMPNLGAPEALEIVRGRSQNIPFIIISGAIGEDVAIKMIKSGANDYILKDKMQRLGTAVVRALEEARERAERKKAEEAVKRSEEYFRAVIENASDIIIIVDKKGTINYISPSIERVGGYKPQEIVGKSVFNFIHPADLPRAAVDFAKAIITREINIPNSFRVRHKDGSERILEGFGKNLFDNPAVAGFIMNVRDVTERKRMEESLRLTQLSVDITADAIVLLRPDGSLSSVNDATCRGLGYSREELLRMAVYDINPAFQGEVWLAHWEELKQRKSLTFESTHRRKDGRMVSVEIISSYLKFEDKEYVCSSARDITDRKKAEEALRESAEKYRLITDNTSDLITIIKFDGTFVYASPSHESLGYKTEDLLGKSGLNMMHPDDRIKLLPVLGKYAKVKVADLFKLKTEVAVEYLNFRFIDKTGNWHNLESTANLIKGFSGERLDILLVSRDVTERMKVEEETKRRIHELEIFHKAAVDRELKMVELKKKLKELEDKQKSSS